MQNHIPKILIIDDDAIASAALEGLLSSEKYELYFASDGMEGISLAVSIQPDVILLDVMMPRMDGFEVCCKIRAMNDIAEIPVILITALDDQDSRLRGLRSGADDFISKPYNVGELFARLQTILRLNRYRRIAEQQEELRFLNVELLTAYDKTIEGWSIALDLRDKDTEGHTRRVTELSVRFARTVGVQGESLEHIRRGALLHDIGKLGIPDAILHKPQSLSEEEWKVMRLHPVYAYEWLRGIDFLKPALAIPYAHHEKWDGSGYPRGLKGDAIPLAARIFAFADVWDALRSDRPYRRALSKNEALAYITSQSGLHFDPSLTDVFISLLAGEYTG